MSVPPDIITSKEQEEVIIFFPLILKKSELNNEEVEFVDIKAEKIFIENIRGVYILYIYYLKTSKEKNVKEFKIKFNIGENQYQLTIKIRYKIYFAFKTELEKIKFFRNKNIEQSVISYKDKFIYFIKALDKIQNEKENEKENYFTSLVNQTIDTIEGEKNLEYFILLLSYCYEEEKSLYKLFLYFSDDFKSNYNKEENYTNLKDKIDNIYQNRNKIIDSLKNEEYIRKEEMIKKQKKPKETKEKIENIFYLMLIYYFLSVDNKSEASEIIKELYKNNKKILFELLKKYSSIFQKFKIVDKELINELLSDKNDYNDIKNILKYENDVLIVIDAINKNKEAIINSLKDKKNTINIFDFIKQDTKDDIETLCKLINDLTKYIKENNHLFIEFNSEFWDYYLNHFNQYTLDYINKLITLRNALNNYQLLFKNNKQFKDKNRLKITDYFSKDDYATHINNKIE